MSKHKAKKDEQCYKTFRSVFHFEAVKNKLQINKFGPNTPCLQIIQYINISLGKHKNKYFNKEQYSRAIWLCGCPVKKPDCQLPSTFFNKKYRLWYRPSRSKSTITKHNHIACPHPGCSPFNYMLHRFMQWSLFLYPEDGSSRFFRNVGKFLSDSRC